MNDRVSKRGNSIEGLDLDLCAEPTAEYKEYLRKTDELDEALQLGDVYLLISLTKDLGNKERFGGLKHKVLTKGISDALDIVRFHAFNFHDVVDKIYIGVVEPYLTSKKAITCRMVTEDGINWKQTRCIGNHSIEYLNRSYKEDENGVYEDDLFAQMGMSNEQALAYSICNYLRRDWRGVDYHLMLSWCHEPAKLALERLHEFGKNHPTGSIRYVG